MKKIFLVMLLLLLLVIGASILLKPVKAPVSNPVPQDSIIDEIKQEFAHKYGKSVDVIEIEVEQNTGDFAKGSVRFTDEFGGAIWFGVKENAKWKLVSDGQGPMMCEVAIEYLFPTSLVPTCIGNRW